MAKSLFLNEAVRLRWWRSEDMKKLLVEDKLWKRVEPLLPAPKPRRFRYSGRKPLDNRQALTGILFVLKTGLAWNDLPQEMGCGSGVACWGRLRDWHQAGVWAALHKVLLSELRYADKIDWSRAAVDATTIRALRGGDKTGKTPTDRGRSGTKDHLLTDQDDGVGFDAATPFHGEQRGFGLLGIAERVRLLGGTYTLQSKPGAGTTVSIHLPLPAPANTAS